MAEGKELEKKADADGEGEQAKDGRLRWLVGWVALPGTVIGSIFLAGVHVGANHPDMWLSRLIAWIGS
jgi:hypothetical protein